MRWLPNEVASAIGSEGLDGFLQVFFEGISAGIAILDRDLRIQFTNRFLQDWLKRAPEEMLGQHCYRMFQHRAEPCQDCPVRETFRTGKISRAELTGLDAVRNPTYAKVTSFPLVSESGEVLFVLEHACDQAAQQSDERQRVSLWELLSDAEQRYRTVVEHCNDAIWILDRAGNFIWFNRRAEEASGYLFDDWVGKSFAPLIAADDLPRIERVFSETLAGTPQCYEVDIKTTAGGTWMLYVRTTPIRFRDEVVGTISFGRDITEERRAQRELVLRNAELEGLYHRTDDALKRKIDELTQNLEELERQRQKAKEVERLKDEFVGMVSHDLRSPLAAIVGQADVLALRATGHPECCKAAQAIQRNGRRMGAMISDLVESERLRSGQIVLRPRPLCLNEIVRELVDALSPEHRGRVILEQGEVPELLLDRQRIERVLTNLITNALKYSPAPSQIVVTIVREEASVRLTVKDQGSGIEPENLPRLFDRFFRATPGAEGEGLGLGLYIARLLVEAHSGRIWAESKRGEGSRFSINLPIEPQQGPAGGT